MARVVGASARTIVNEDPLGGQASSLRAGLEACDPSSEAAVVLLADQPEVERSATEAVVARWRETRAAIVRARYRDGIGHPVLLDRRVWSELDVEGDEGARSFIALHPELVEEVALPGPRPIDVDTPADYRALLQGGAVQDDGRGPDGREEAGAGGP